MQAGPSPKFKARRNRVFAKAFDSTLGYPGEGPAPRKSKRGMVQTRRNSRIVRGAERFVARRTQLERLISRWGIGLRRVAMKPGTKALYREAFEALWYWVGRAPPRYVGSRRAYDAILSEYVCQACEHGLTRGNAANALSASVAAYPELR